MDIRPLNSDPLDFVQRDLVPGAMNVGREHAPGSMIVGGVGQKIPVSDFR
jgi:hypothetical protein